MKTKVKIAIFICLLFTLAEVSAQTFYYNATKTFNESGYAYKCNVDTQTTMVDLYNASNLKTNTEWKFKDGSPLTERIRFGYESLIVSDTWTKPKCYAIVNNAFSATEKQRVKAVKLMVCMTIDTSTGKVTEVDFSFRSSGGFGTIPVSVYRKIELELKSNIWFTLTDIGKKLNYVKRSWMQEVK